MRFEFNIIEFVLKVLTGLSPKPPFGARIGLITAVVGEPPDTLPFYSHNQNQSLQL